MCQAFGIGFLLGSISSEKINAEALAALADEVRRAQGGDATAMCGLIENNRTWVRGIAYAVLGDAHLAEDAAQDVCVRMVKHLRGLDTPEAFRPWVYRMTRNVALSMAQRRERAPQPLGLDAEQMSGGGIQVSRDDPPGAALEAEERFNVVLETIHRLPHIYREVLVLKHVQDLSYAEMSAILGVRGELPADARTLPLAGRSDCQKSQVSISKYVDGELTAADTGGLRDHLIKCESCRAQLQNWKAQAALMGEVLDALWRPQNE